MRAVVLSLVPLALAACGSTPPPRPLARTVLHVPGSPQQAFARARDTALARGWRIADQGIDSLVVDFGVATARVADLDGGTRDTEIHATALLRFDFDPTGASVTLWSEPIWWHPDRRAWFAAPSELAPGDSFLADCYAPRDLAEAASARASRASSDAR